MNPGCANAIAASPKMSETTAHTRAISPVRRSSNGR